MYINYNPNPCGKLVGDCVIRGISKLLNQSWRDTYLELFSYAYELCDLPSSNAVWSSYLTDLKNYTQKNISVMTVKEFCENHKKGTYLLATGSHVVAVKNGNYYDAWDSGNELITFYFFKEE